ncbi:phosphodiester glycosidase family protein [Nodosilinea sp. LEGE 06152]|uniref:phosphodiester glycosidase family protein n=1 Tax=Nodosilinea sp. LEGE 06152 TaxID=2777966 RepID=UPI001881B5CF|nr:phosphodiester glycosidase family protein [Nodosilinea sp. LEGE 06152]MBE9158273.1 phosphodiester glycosidase family protein [Nodosilinea sp. LEGE 06152]
MVKLPGFALFPGLVHQSCRWVAGGWVSLSLLGAIAPLAATATVPSPVPEATLAEATPAEVTAANPTAQGQILIVNGTQASVPWMITNGQVGLADYGVTDQLGATLLSSNQPNRQPIQWFTDPGGAVELAAWVHDGYRYLDIIPLAQRHGWQVQPQGNVLQITAPPVQVTAVRRETLSGGDRLTLDLSGPVPAALSDSADALTLTLGATAADRVLREAIAAPAGAYLGSLTVTPVAGALRFQASASQPPRLYTRANQIVIDTRADALQPHSIAWAPGVRWQQRYISVAGQPFPVYWLQLDPAQVNLRPIWTDPTTATGTAPLTTIAQRWQAAAAINAGFFNRNNQYPLGAVRANSDWVSGPILSRGVVGWNDQGQVRMDRLVLNQTLTTASGQTFPVQAINSGYVQAGIGLYTPTWGPTYRPVLDGETIVTVVDGVVVNQRAASTLGAAGLPIPTNGYLLALRSYATAAQALPPGQQVSLASELLPATLAPFPNLIGGGPLLLRDRTLVLDAGLEQFSQAFATQAAPRSAIGITSTGEILLVAVHNSPAGSGPTLNQLAQIMLQLGTTDALNLDGGSSASLYLGGRLINRSPRTAARVNNGIGLFLR